METFNQAGAVQLMVLSLSSCVANQPALAELPAVADMIFMEASVDVPDAVEALVPR